MQGQLCLLCLHSWQLPNSSKSLHGCACCWSNLSLWYPGFFVFIQQLIYCHILVHVWWWSRYYASNKRKKQKNLGGSIEILCARNWDEHGYAWCRLCAPALQRQGIRIHTPPKGMEGVGSNWWLHCQSHPAGVSGRIHIHPCLNRHRPSLTERRQPCQSRAIKIMDSGRASATWGAFATDHCVWSDTT